MTTTIEMHLMRGSVNNLIEVINEDGFKNEVKYNYEAINKGWRCNLEEYSKRINEFLKINKKGYIVQGYTSFKPKLDNFKIAKKRNLEILNGMRRLLNEAL